ncbi:MAG: hypothetical protein QOJ29_3077 [Thermoleophilaceae bacterium]|jgi:hypothetical protein|nr:hypothetical protein [Thermoleophilaceae bacterium]
MEASNPTRSPARFDPALPGSRARLERRYLGYIALGALAASLLLIVVIVIPVSYQSRDTLIATGFLGVLIVAVAAFRFSQTGGDSLDPLFLISLVFLFYFVLHGIWAVFNEHWLSASIPAPYADHLVSAAIVLAIAFLSLVAGHYAMPLRPRPGVRTSIFGAVDRTPRSLLIGLFVLGMLFNGAAAAAGGYAKTTIDVYNTGGNVLLLKTFGYCGYVAYVIALCQAFIMPPGPGRRSARILALGIMLPAQVAVAFAVGAKQEIVFAVLPLLVVRNYLVSPLRARTLLATALAFTFIVSPVIQASREGPGAVVSGNNEFASGLDSIANTLVTVPKRLEVLTQPVKLLDGYNVINRRTNGIESMALALRYTPYPNPYQRGKSFAAVPLSLIPRFIWPDKPLYSVGKYFSVSYAGQSATQGRGYGLTVSPTYPADLYVNFGLFGVIIGCLLMGMVLRAVSVFMHTRRQGRALPIIVYLVVIIPAMLVEQDVATGLNAIMLRLIVSFAFVYGLSLVVRRMSKGSAAANAPTAAGA